MTALPPLDGVRVVDLSRVLAGPFCTALLADAGADVVKIESKAGEDSRHLGPFRDGESIYFNVLNRGKRSIALDLKDPEDREALLQLIEGADVVVENFRPGVTTRLGIDYEAAKARNPKIVYASISGFGQQGPMAGAAAYDLVVQALSGVMSITGTEESGPTRLGESSATPSPASSLRGASAPRCWRPAPPARASTSTSRCSTACSRCCPPRTASCRRPARPPSGSATGTPCRPRSDTYRADDGLFVLAIASEKGFQTLARTMGREELITDPGSTRTRCAPRTKPALRKEIESWAAGRTVTEVPRSARRSRTGGSEVWNVQQALARTRPDTAAS